jgi:hypothetical protein
VVWCEFVVVGERVTPSVWNLIEKSESREPFGSSFVRDEDADAIYTNFMFGTSP